MTNDNTVLLCLESIRNYYSHAHDDPWEEFDLLSEKETEALLIAEKSIKMLRSLKDQIFLLKRAVKSENSDYLTGYMCALSAVEGMIAEVENES